MGFFLQEYWSGLPFPSPGNLFDPGIKLTSPVLAGGFFFTTVATWEAPFILPVRTPDSFNHLYNSLESGPVSALQSCYSSNNCIPLASLVLGLSSLLVSLSQILHLPLLPAAWLMESPRLSFLVILAHFL